MNTISIDAEEAWAAVLRRDRAFDGRFVTGVLSTGIYCRPSCAARHPARRNVVFHADGAAARGAGLRACLRCRPDEIARDEAGIARAVKLIEGAEEPPSLAEMAEAAGYAPHHFHRLFRRAMGVTPAAFARTVRAQRTEDALGGGAAVTDAIYEGGFAAPSRFYAEVPDRLGMTPSAWRAGGRGVTIRWSVAETTFGTILVAATSRGICRLAFEEDAARLRGRFPAADIIEDRDGLGGLLEQAVAAVERPELRGDLPLDIAGTAFQTAIWQALAAIPPGETRSYAALAAAAGNARAVRAAGTACGSNPVAVLIPCHRAVRADGGMGGYAWGEGIKRALLAQEKAGTAQ